MKARVTIFSTGKYGKNGEYIVELKKVEYFENGKINKAKTLRNGYDILEVIKKPYGFGIQSESIKELL